MRIDLYLAKTNPAYSRAYFQKLIKSGNVRVNNLAVKPDYKLKSEDKINIAIPRVEKRDYGSLKKYFKIIHEDSSILVIDKPVGMSVHPAGEKRPNKETTLLDILQGKYPDANYSDFSGRPFIVHRLDRGTSGVMVIAKTPAAQFGLMNQFAQRTIKKTYLGIVHGIFKEKKGTIDAPLTRDMRDRRKFCIGAGRESVTGFKVLDSFGKYSFLEITPLTGRTHQIRVHLSAIGHPVAGDNIYSAETGPGKPGPGRPGIFKRQMLHAYKLVLRHPKTKKAMEFRAEIPKDFKNALKYIKST